MSRDIVLQWLLYRGAAIVMITIMFAAIYFSSESIDYLHSLYAHGNIIVYNTKAVAGATGVPVYIYGICISLRVLFTKGVKPPTTQTPVGRILGAFCTIITVTGMITAFIIPIGLMFSPYSNCPQDKLGDYYVTDLKLCDTINNNRITKPSE